MLRGEFPWSMPTHVLWRTRSDATWVQLPSIGEPLDAVRHIGNGKDAYLTFELATGREIELTAKGVHVDIEGPVGVTTTPWGNTALRTDYTGTDLMLIGGRMSYSANLDDPWTQMFLREANAWIKSGLKGELAYAVSVEIRLRASSTLAAVA